MKKCFKSGFVIKAALLLFIQLICFSQGNIALAETAVQGKIINASSKIQNSTNVAAGSDNKAKQFSVTLKNSRLNGTVANSTRSKSSVNIAAGKRNVANQGSVSISRGKVKGLVSNNVITEKTTNLSVGSDNRANQSSVVIKNSTVNGAVINRSKGKAMINAAVGSRNQANQATVAIKNSSVSGKISNSSVGQNKVNMAVGNSNIANQGSTSVDTSTIRGAVVNTAKINKGVNLAAGKNNSASQASIIIDKSQLRGAVVNSSKSENTLNAAIGFGNEAHMSSIVVDGDQSGASAVKLVENNQSTTPGLLAGQALMQKLPLTQEKPQSGKPNVAANPVNRGEKGEVRAQSSNHVPGQVVFLVDNDKGGLASLDRIAEKYQLDVGEKTVLKSLNRIMVVSSTEKDAAEIAEALKEESGVYNSQPNYVFKTMGKQDPLSPMQNLVSMLDLQEVHGNVTGKNVTVAVVDTGVEIAHQDLHTSIVGYHNFIKGSDYKGEIHGTAVAGIIGADINQFGIVGIAPDVSLLALRACRQINSKSAEGECFSTSLVRSLDAAITAEVNLVNLSLGAHVNDTLMSTMIESGHEKGIFFAAPVGNDPETDLIAFPASHEKVISIAGLDEKGNPLPNRQLASKADAVAPATHLFVTTPGNNYNFIDGTSLASASISGIIALSLGKKNSNNSPCLPHFNSGVPWPKQVFACIGL